MKFAVLAVVVLLVTLWPGSSAEAKSLRTIADLRDYCRVADPNSVTALTNERECMGYVQGALDMYLYGKPATICLPSTARLGQIIAVILKWSDARPEVWHQPAPHAILIALSDAFPCKR